MYLSYHLLILPEKLRKIDRWQTACQEWGFDVHFTVPCFTDKSNVLQVNYKGRVAKINVYTSPMSDIADICDELRQHIIEEQNLALNFDFNSDQENVYSMTIALLVLTRLLQGTLYIEGDGTFFTADQALENARAIDSTL